MPHITLFLNLALHTAARAGALLSLRWSAVDFKRRLIDLGSGVGNKGRAVVPINDELNTALTYARQMATTEWVIEHGGRQVASVKNGTRAAALRAELPGVTPHILRHTAASWMVMANVPLVEVARFLGHRDTAMVERVYGKHSPDYLRRAAGALTGPVAPETLTPVSQITL